MCRNKLTFVFRISVLCSLIAIHSLLASDVKIIQSSDQGLVISYEPKGWDVSAEQQENMSFIKVKIPHCIFNTIPGEPLIPKRRITVGIPPNAKISAEVLETKLKEQQDGELIPTPLIMHEELGDVKYEKNKANYNFAERNPGKFINLSSPLKFRDQRIVQVDFFPVQFAAQSRKVFLYDKIVIRIHFDLQPQSDSKKSQKVFLGTVYDQILINAEQASKWRKTDNSKVRLHKPATAESFYKICVKQDGIYKITGNDLKAAGIDIEQINPKTLKLFNNGGFPLPTSLDAKRPDSLIENSILMMDGGDFSFDENDYFLFYGKSVHGWKYDRNEKQYHHYLHPFTNENVYWLQWQSARPGKRVEIVHEAPDNSILDVQSYRAHQFVENELTNLLNSGTCWLGNYFSSVALDRIYQFLIHYPDQNHEASIRLQLAAISNGYHSFSYYFNDSRIGSTNSIYGSSSQTININLKKFSTMINGLLLKDGYNRFKMHYHPPDDAGLAYLDWIELHYYAQLKTDENELIFDSPDSSGFYRYTVESFSSDNVYVFDVTKFEEIRQIDRQFSSGVVEFVDSTSSDMLKTYFIVGSDKFKKPLTIEKDLPSDLRSPDNGADFIVITYDDFYNAVLPLKSLKENCDTLQTAVVNISDVYDEFAWGLNDITAIRDFIKYAYENWHPRPEYVLLFGDGDYDYKNIISPQNPNWIPTFETDELIERTSRCRDDWFVCVSGNDNILDLAIGRIPARSYNQAREMVEKIIEYQNSVNFGEWCNKILMVADDEYGQGGGLDAILDHLPDTENIAENYLSKSFNVQKIYLTEYPVVRVAGVSGIRKPAAKEALLKKINDGSLIINFIGHANERLWTHEHVLHLSDDFSRINNGYKQAFWMAATCNFGRFDNPNFQSFAEELVLAKGRGAVAVLSSSRLANPYDNASLNEFLFRKLFPADKSLVRLGDAVMAAKNARGNNTNDQVYHLLGDPTLVLKVPTLDAKVSRFSPDSIRALSVMQVTGNILNPGDASQGYNGKVLLSAFDSRKKRVYHVNQFRTYHYKLPGNKIFYGTSNVENNQFDTKFFVPKDITYGGNEGRFNLFYWDGQQMGAGSVNLIPVGGTQTEFSDLHGPKISVDFEGQELRFGGFIPPNADIVISLEDSLSGINIAGDIGHKITMTIDQQENDPIDLTELFQYDEGSYTSGKIYYCFENMAAGKHSALIKAWDNCNNSSQTEIEFDIVSREQLVLRDVFNFPNPFAHETEFTFWVNQDCDVKIKVYTVTGRLIYQMDHLRATTGFNHFSWDGCDQNYDPVANGVYLYKVSAKSRKVDEILSADKIEKCVVVR